MASLRVLSVFLTLLVACSFSYGAVVVVDPFETGSSFSVNPNQTVSDSQNASEALGGNRYITIDAGAGSLGIDIDVGSGTFYYSAKDGVPGDARIEWGHNGDLNADFSSTFDILPAFWGIVGHDSACGAFDAVLTLEDGDGTVQSVTRNVAASTVWTSERVQWEYSAFSDIDFTDVDNIVLEFNDIGGGGDLSFDFLQGGAVPEPATFAMVLLALGVIRLTRRRA